MLSAAKNDGSTYAKKQNQSREFRTRALGTSFHKMNDDLMTINGSQSSRRVSSNLSTATLVLVLLKFNSAYLF